VLDDLRSTLAGAMERGRWAVGRHLRHEATRVQSGGAKLGQALAARAAAARERVDAAGRVLSARSPAAHVRRWRQLLAESGRRLDAAVGPRLRSARERLDARLDKLAALDPTAVLGRGFSLSWTEDGGRRTLIRDGATLAPGSVIRTTFAAGPDAISTVEGAAERTVATTPP
jgi:exodeoxyribonuclease VII large subunit